MISKFKLTSWVAALLVSALTVTVLAKPSESLVKMKTGPCKFVLLDSRGVAPLSGWSLALNSPENGQALVQGTTDQSGVCELNVAPGRYIVSVDNMDLAILDAQADQTIAECRIVVPEKPMLVGGEEAAGEAGAAGGTGAAVGGGGSLTPFVVGGAVILAGAGGYAIYENNDDDDDDDSPTPPPPTTTTRPRSSSQPVSQ